MFFRRLLAIAFVSILTLACESKSPDESNIDDKNASEETEKIEKAGDPSKSGGSSIATDEGNSAPDEKDSQVEEDKGHTKLMLDDREWSVERTSARLKDDGKLRISASRSETIDGKTHRESLTLVIKEYAGPGSYVLSDMNSNFTGVGIDVGRLAKAEKDGDAKKVDEEATKEAMKAVQGASVALLRDAKVEITGATADHIDGTVEWEGVTALRGPKRISGSFHAKIRKKK